MVTLASAPGGRPKLVAVRSSAACGSNATGDGAKEPIKVYVDGRATSLTKAQQHQKKANRIVAEAIAKAHAEGIDIESSDSKVSICLGSYIGFFYLHCTSFSISSLS